MSFGGSGDFRDGIEIAIRDNGSAAADAVAEAMRNLAAAVADTYQEIAAGGPTTNEAVARLRSYEGQLKQLQKAHDQITDALKAGAATSEAAAQGLRDYAATMAPLANSSKQAAAATEALAEYAGAVTPRMQAAAAAARQQATDEEYLDRQTRQLAGAMDSLARHEATATKAIDASAAAGGAASPKYSKMGMAAIEAARGVEDLQFGLYAAMNNLAQAVTIMGGPVGAIVGVTLLGVAVSQLAKHWDELMVGMAQDPLEKLADDAATLKRQIEDLEKKPTKLDIDISVLDEARRKLDEIEEKRQAYESAAKAQTDTQGKVAAAVRHAVVETAGGTDEESGTENLARAIEESRARRGKFISPEDSQAIAAKEAEVARLRKLVASPAAGEDAQSIAQQKAFLEQQEQQLGLLNQAAVKRAQERVRTGLIGGALRGIDARRAEIQAEVGADPEFFRRRGIGDQFAGAIDLASAENQRALARTDTSVRQQTRAHQTVEMLRKLDDRQAQEDKARTDEGRRVERLGDELQIQARKKGVPLLTDITGSLDDLDAKAAAKDARADTKEARQRAAEVARLARQNARALQGAGGDLTANVLAGMGMGMTPEQMAAQFAPAAGARLAQVPGIKPGDVQAVAEKAVADEIAKQAPNTAAQHAAAAFGEGTDATSAQVLAMTKRAVQLNARGMDMQRAEQEALLEMATQLDLNQQRYLELSNSLAVVQQQLQMSAGRNVTDGRTRVRTGRRGGGG